ncbi:MAG: OprO/OprP family phosphate-selective porin [Alphaproteobacteria bacterium]|nr:OprO/OprP family phosphate-selective porin [Alphaproteobacteria bacterium]
MKKTLWLASTAIVAAAMITAPAYAGGKTKTDTRDQEIQELKARLDRLERESEDEKVANGSRLKKIEETQDAVQWTFNDGRPTVRSGDGRFEMSIRGRFMFDMASFEQDPSDFGAGYGAVGSCNLTNVLCDQGSGAVFRRVRLGVEGRFFKDFIYEMRFDFGGSGSEGAGTVNIMRVGYVGIPGLRIHAGAIQPIITMYDATSSADLTTMERAGIITTLVGAFGGDNARRGIEATYQKENLFYQGDNFIISSAYTGERIGADHTGIPNNDENTQLLGRIAYRLFSDGESNLQIGASASEILDPPSTITLQERPEIRVGGDRFVNTGAIAVDGGTAYGFELGANFKNLYLAAEWYEMSLDRTGATPDAEFSGWYVEGEWIITGENKRYAAGATNNNVGVFRSPSVASPWSLGGGTGAWSLHGRYSVLDLNDNEGSVTVATPAGGVRGGEQTITNVGVTWYMNSNLKLMGEYSMVDIEKISTAAGFASQDAEFDIVQGRVQFTF